MCTLVSDVTTKRDQGSILNNDWLCVWERKPRGEPKMLVVTEKYRSSQKCLKMVKMVLD